MVHMFIDMRYFLHKFLFFNVFERPSRMQPVDNWLLIHETQKLPKSD